MTKIFSLLLLLTLALLNSIMGFSLLCKHSNVLTDHMDSSEHECEDGIEICHYKCTDHFTYKNTTSCPKPKYVYIELPAYIQRTTYHEKCDLEGQIKSALLNNLGVNSKNACSGPCTAEQNLYKEFKTKFVESALIVMKHVCDREINSVAAYNRAEAEFNRNLGGGINGNAEKISQVKNDIITKVILRSYESRDPLFCRCSLFNENFNSTDLAKEIILKEKCKSYYPECGYSDAGPTTFVPSTTQIPTTQYTTTQAPTTQTPTTQYTTTHTPTTQYTTTQSPTSQTPTTQYTTQTPTTQYTTTQTPTTQYTTTQSPTSQTPTTQAPTTKMPFSGK